MVKQVPECLELCHKIKMSLERWVLQSVCVPRLLKFPRGSLIASLMVFGVGSGRVVGVARVKHCG